LLFHSVEFLVFLAVVLGLYFLATSSPVKPLIARNAVLLLAGYVFYAAWDVRFLALLVLSTLVDFFCSIWIPNASPGGKRALLGFSIAFNLGILGVFKYFDFFMDSFESMVQAIGFSGFESTTLGLILPLGISFYTFQTLAYTIDVYRGKIQPCRSLLDYAVFVSFFPQLVAGPIERASRMLPQLYTYQKPSVQMIRNGLSLALMGFFKKVVVGDAIASPYVDQAFANPEAQTPEFLVLGACMFTIQLYADFSGYSDIARGVSRLFGIELMVNFQQPFLSRNITEFWRRWHISLSTWLRDYLYIPMGGNRRGLTVTYLNLMITMLIGGLWHGASWNFVAWGGMHGIYLAIHRSFRDRKEEPSATASRLFSPGALGSIFCTNVLVILTFVLFRATDLPTALIYLEGMAGIFESAHALALALSALVVYFLIVALLDLAPYLRQREEFIELLPFWARTLTYTFLGLAIWTAWPTSESPFIYFQF